MILTLIDTETRALVEGTTGLFLPDERSPDFFGALDELESRFPALYVQVMATFAEPAQLHPGRALPNTMRADPAAWLWQRPVLAGRPIFNARRLSAAALMCGAVCAAPVLVSQFASGPQTHGNQTHGRQSPGEQPPGQASSLPATAPQPTLGASTSSVPKPMTSPDASRRTTPAPLQVTPPVPSAALPLPERVPAPALPVAQVRTPQATSQTARTGVVPDPRRSTALPLKPTVRRLSPAPNRVVAAAPAVRKLSPLPAPARSKGQAQAKVLPPAPGPVQVAAPVVRPVRRVTPPVPRATAKITAPVPAPGQRAGKPTAALKALAAVKVLPASPAIIRPTAAQPLSGRAGTSGPESALTVYQNGAGTVGGGPGQLTSLSSGGLSPGASPSAQVPVAQGESGLTIYTTPVSPKR